MTIELMIGGANLVAMVGYFMRSESRITKLETLVQLLIEERKRK
jgi:hypothetical protein